MSTNIIELRREVKQLRRERDEWRNAEALRRKAQEANRIKQIKLREDYEVNKKKYDKFREEWLIRNAEQDAEIKRLEEIREKKEKMD